MLVLVAAFFFIVSDVNAFPLNDSDSVIQKALIFMNNSQQDNGGFNDSSSSYYSDLTPFAIIAIKAANQDPHNWIKGSNSPIDFIRNVSVPALNSSAPPTYYGVVIMALVAAGENPQNFSGRNLTGELMSRQIADGSFNGSTWITDQEWSILALVASGYKNTSIVQNATQYLISQQKSDGGFGWFCPDISSSCPDETSLGIMALISSGQQPNSTNIGNALSRLKQFQVLNGGVDSGWGANVDSDSWATQAIISTGNNFTEWIKSNFTINTSSNFSITNILTNFSITATLTNYGNNYPFSNLIRFQDSVTGGFNYFKPVQDTGYAIMALMGKPFPLNSTSFNQTASGGVYYNQTFSLNISQSENWNFIISINNTQLNAESSNISLYIFTPSDSSGKENNITVTTSSLTDNINQSENIVVTVQILCGNSVCEAGESCSACTSDCGSCPQTNSQAPASSSGVDGGGFSSSECRKENYVCTENSQCCSGLDCVQGICKATTQTTTTPQQITNSTTIQTLSANTTQPLTNITNESVQSRSAITGFAGLQATYFPIIAIVFILVALIFVFLKRISRRNKNT